MESQFTMFGSATNETYYVTDKIYKMIRKKTKYYNIK